MTIFAVLAAGSCVALHTGRIWMDYYLFPIPNQMGLWPNFRSPLEWDVFAVNTYLTVSLLFWFTGLVPDFATLRDRTKVRWRQMFYGVLSLGWRGSHRHWVTYEKAYQILAFFSFPLVLLTTFITMLAIAAASASFLSLGAKIAWLLLPGPIAGLIGIAPLARAGARAT